jgi:anti-anti-sigma regulatory factor
MLRPHVEVREAEGFLVAEFFDCLRLDPAPVRDLKSLYEQHVLRGGRIELLIDLNGVDYAGSTALGGFLSIRRLGARVIFFNVEANVREIFRLIKLESLFQFATDQIEAVELARAESSRSTRPESSPLEGGVDAVVKAPNSPGPLRRSRRPSG